jgi:hypothetical protein
MGVIAVIGHTRFLPKESAFSTRFRRLSAGESFRTIDPLTTSLNTEHCMARYSAFLGRRVEVQYRAADIVLPASGTFVADSGRSIFLEQHLQQRGQQKHFRWEIPYQYIVRLEAIAEPPDTARSTDIARTLPVAARNSSPAAQVTAAAASLLPLPNRPKPA